MKKLLSKNKKKSLKNKIGLIAAIYILINTIFPIICFAETYELGNIGIIPIPRNNETRQTFNYTLQAGNEITDFIIVTNKSDIEKKIILFSADYLLTEQGGANFKNYYDSQEDVGNWIELEKSKLSLPPGKAIIVKFTIKIPQNVKQQKYLGGILAQDISENFNGIGLRVAKEVSITITDSHEYSESKKYQEQDYMNIIFGENDSLFKKPIFLSATCILIIFIVAISYKIWKLKYYKK